MRTAHLILALFVGFGSIAVAQEGSDSKTSSKKKKASGTSATGTSSTSKKKTTSSSTTTASKSKSKPTSSGSKTAGAEKDTTAKEDEKPKAEESKKESASTTAEKGSNSSSAGSSEKKEISDSTSTAKAKSQDGTAASSSKKTTTDSDKSAAEEDEGTDERDPTKAGKRPAAVSSITPEEIEGFDTYPAPTQQLIRRSLELTTQNLRYQFGSADPKAGGMDCSGTVYRVLQDSGIKDVPRQSDEICRWVMRHTLLYRTEDTSTLKDKSLSALKPGDLLFWTGTYDTSNPRELPISHVMLYLGKRKKDGKPVVFGASDGRTYDGQRRNGVSVFDFVMPKRDGKAAFYGYGPVPGLKNTATGGTGQ